MRPCRAFLSWLDYGFSGEIRLNLPLKYELALHLSAAGGPVLWDH